MANAVNMSVMLYLVAGQWRVPWAIHVYRGKDTPSPAQLGLRLVRRLPKILTQHFEVLVLADTAFGSNEFVTKVRDSQASCSYRSLL